jgi:4-amino-4-deoxy-L-arabinose transferase-like glycosyltransferase
MPRGAAIGMVLVIGLGVGLRTAQYAAGTSLWHDELRLALNLDARSPLELVAAPLDFLQVAPPAFLLACALAARLPVTEEFSLRLLPWLSSLASLFMFWRVTLRLLPRLPAAAALLPFAVSPALVWYGGNAKPYAVDVAATLLLVWLVLRFDEQADDPWIGRLGAVSGAVAIFASFAAIPTAGTLILLLAWRSRRVAYPPASLLRLAGPWIAAAILVFAWTFYTVDPATRAQMSRYWVHGFPPAPWQGATLLTWLPGRLLTTLAHLLLFDPRQLGTVGWWTTVGFAAATGAGLFAMAAERRWQAAVVLAPVAAAIAASVLHQLPFDGRVSIYAGWPVLIAATAGLQACVIRARPPLRPALAALAAVLVTGQAALVLTVAMPPYRHQPSREVLSVRAGQVRPGDRLFVYYGAVPAMTFYGRRLGLLHWTAGECHRGDPRAYLREVDSLRGEARVWFVYTHGALGWKEPESIRGYLGAIGRERDRISDPLGLSGEREAAAILYDLSDPDRLAAADPETYTLDQVPRGMRTLSDGTRVETTSVLSQPSIPLRSRP